MKAEYLVILKYSWNSDCNAVLSLSSLNDDSVFDDLLLDEIKIRRGVQVEMKYCCEYVVIHENKISILCGDDFVMMSFKEYMDSLPEEMKETDDTYRIYEACKLLKTEEV